MTQVYTGEEYIAERKLQKRFLHVWLGLLGAVVAVVIACLIINALLPYKSPIAVYPRAAAYIISIIFALLSYPFLAVKYTRMKNYVKILKHIQDGLKEGWTGEFIEFNRAVEVKEGVDFYSMTTYEFNSHKDEYFIRKVLLDRERPMPELNEGDMVHYITQGNILVAYEVIPRPQDEPAARQKKASVLKKDKREAIKL